MKTEKKFMIVNNFEHLSKYFNQLTDREDFYFVQIIQRKKDGYDKSERVIKNFYFYNIDEFLSKRSFIIDICEKYNARAYFWINPRNSRKIALECIKSYAELLQTECNSGHKIWDKKCGLHPDNKYETLWIIDIDTKDETTIQNLYNIVNECRGNREQKIVDVIETLNGYHFISVSFDIHQFKQHLAMKHLNVIDVHKNSPTLLYYAENGRENL